MSITYYYSPMSTALRTTWLVEELQLKCEKVKLDLQKKETKTDAFLKLNPNGTVPLLVVDGTNIFESTAIMLYLGETYGVDKGLYAAPGLQRAEQLKWIVWANVGLFSGIHRFAQNTASYVPDELKNAKAAEAARGELDKSFAILEQALAGKTYLTEEKFTVADLAVSSYLGWLKFMGYDFSAHKNVSAWSDRCFGRPSFAAANAA